MTYMCRNCHHAVPPGRSNCIECDEPVRMTDAERMDKAAELAAKTGVVYVSKDIAEALSKLPERAVPLAWQSLASIRIEVDSSLPPGTIMAADLKPIWDAAFSLDEE